MTIGNLNESTRKKTFFLIAVRNIFTKLGETLTFPAPCILESCIKREINFNFYFHSPLWCLKRFYENLLRHQREV